MYVMYTNITSIISLCCAWHDKDVHVNYMFNLWQNLYGLANTMIINLAKPRLTKRVSAQTSVILLHRG